MKKIDKFIKSNIKTVVAFILGIVVAGGTVYAATLAASSVSFNKTNVTQYGATKDNVQDAISELYGKANDLSKYKTSLQSICGTGEVGTPTSFATDSWATICVAARTGNTSVYAPTANGVDNQVLRTVDMGSLGTHYLRVANTTPCSGAVADTSCGFVIEFADIITTVAMNSSSTLTGGYPGSSLFSYINNTVLPAMPEEIKNIMIPVTLLSYTGEEAQPYITPNQYLYVLSSKEVYGSSGPADITTVTLRQLDYYSSNSDIANKIKKRGTTATRWWLRVPTSTAGSTFRVVNTHGNFTNSTNTMATVGLSPAFRIG